MIVGWTTEEVRDAVYEYLTLPYGSRGPWLRERGISKHTMARWRNTVLAGDLDRGFVPRRGLLVSSSEAREIARLVAQVKALQEQLAAKDQELERQVGVSRALGKALGLLQQLSGSEQPLPPAETGHDPSCKPPSSGD